MTVDLARVEKAVAEILEAIGEDPSRDGLLGTPGRVASMYEELFSGLHDDPARHLTVTFAADHDEMVMVRDIPFASLCEHHLVPFIGRAHVAYIPNADGRITGISKLARLVDGFARRLQVQERMTTEIADAIETALDPRGVLVVVEAEHLCMSMRGVKKPGTLTITSAVRGLFRRDPATRAEAMQFVHGREKPPPRRGSSPTLPTVLGIDERHPLVMGVLNVTPDFFFDGGRYADCGAAVARGVEMAGQGADVIDVGGESSRPGATPVPEDEELRRVVPVVEALVGRVRLSVDTVKPAVARAAVAAGASLINDVSGTLWPVAAECGVGWVAMHRQGTPADMQRDPCDDDVVAEVREHLLGLLVDARRAGVDELWVDPGIGFGKTVSHNLSLLAHLDSLVGAAHETGARVLVGTSNKWFLGVVGSGGGDPLPAPERAEGTIASSTWAMTQGAAMVRVHDVVAGVQAARLVGPVVGAVAEGEDR